jgi:hypothetical protein
MSHSEDARSSREETEKVIDYLTTIAVMCGALKPGGSLVLRAPAEAPAELSFPDELKKFMLSRLADSVHAGQQFSALAGQVAGQQLPRGRTASKNNTQLKQGKGRKNAVAHTQPAPGSFSTRSTHTHRAGPDRPSSTTSRASHDQHSSRTVPKQIYQAPNRFNDPESVISSESKNQFVSDSRGLFRFESRERFGRMYTMMTGKTGHRLTQQGVPAMLGVPEMLQLQSTSPRSELSQNLAETTLIRRTRKKKRSRRVDQQ